jgi:tripartite-type tricarboxylate transporter receptor subunit TctC
MRAMLRHRIGGVCLALACALALLGAAARAQTAKVEEFYRGKTIRLVIGIGAGSTYDAYARLLARSMVKYIPGHPQILPQQMPGAGSLNAFNHIYNAAPRDGTVFGTGHRSVLLMPLFNQPGPQFDARKFSYIGSANSEVVLLIAWRASGIASIEDLKSREMLLGTTGSGAELEDLNQLVARVLGARIRIISGYPDTRAIDLALERGEIQGRSTSYSSLKTAQPRWLAEDRVSLLVQLGAAKHAELPQVPWIVDLVADPLDKQAVSLLTAPSVMGRIFVGTPDIPADRLAALRQAFQQALADPELLADAARQKMEISPTGGAELAALIDRLYDAPQPVLSRAAALAGE